MTVLGSVQINVSLDTSGVDKNIKDIKNKFNNISLSPEVKLDIDEKNITSSFKNISPVSIPVSISENDIQSTLSDLEKQINNKEFNPVIKPVIELDEKEINNELNKINPTIKPKIEINEKEIEDIFNKILNKKISPEFNLNEKELIADINNLFNKASNKTINPIVEVDENEILNYLNKTFNKAGETIISPTIDIDEKDFLEIINNINNKSTIKPSVEIDNNEINKQLENIKKLKLKTSLSDNKTEKESNEVENKKDSNKNKVEISVQLSKNSLKNIKLQLSTEIFKINANLGNLGIDSFSTSSSSKGSNDLSSSNQILSGIKNVLNILLDVLEINNKNVVDIFNHIQKQDDDGGIFGKIFGAVTGVFGKIADSFLSNLGSDIYGLVSTGLIETISSSLIGIVGGKLRDVVGGAIADGLGAGFSHVIDSKLQEFSLSGIVEGLVPLAVNKLQDAILGTDSSNSGGANSKKGQGNDIANIVGGIASAIQTVQTVTNVASSINGVGDISGKVSDIASSVEAIGNVANIASNLINGKHTGPTEINLTIPGFDNISVSIPIPGAKRPVGRPKKKKPTKSSTPKINDENDVEESDDEVSTPKVKNPVVKKPKSGKSVKSPSTDDVLKPISLPENEINEIAAKLKEEYTAKGLLEIARNLGIKASGKNRNLDPLARLIAESASLPDIESIASALGDKVKKLSVEDVINNINIPTEKLTLENEENLLKYLREVNDKLTDKLNLYQESRDGSIQKIVEDIDNILLYIDDVIKTFKYKPETGKALGGFKTKLKAKRKKASSLVDESIEENEIQAPKPTRKPREALPQLTEKPQLTSAPKNIIPEVIKPPEPIPAPTPIPQPINVPELVQDKIQVSERTRNKTSIERKELKNLNEKNNVTSLPEVKQIEVSQEIDNFKETLENLNKSGEILNEKIDSFLNTGIDSVQNITNDIELIETPKPTKKPRGTKKPKPVVEQPVVDIPQLTPEPVLDTKNIINDINKSSIDLKNIIEDYRNEGVGNLSTIKSNIDDFIKTIDKLLVLYKNVPDLKTELNNIKKDIKSSSKKLPKVRKPSISKTDTVESEPIETPESTKKPKATRKPKQTPQLTPEPVLIPDVEIPKIEINEDMERLDSILFILNNLAQGLNERLEIYKESQVGSLENIQEDIGLFLNRINQVISLYENVPQITEPLTNMKDKILNLVNILSDAINDSNQKIEEPDDDISLDIDKKLLGILDLLGENTKILNNRIELYLENGTESIDSITEDIKSFIDNIDETIDVFSSIRPEITNHLNNLKNNLNAKYEILALAKDDFDIEVETPKPTKKPRTTKKTRPDAKDVFPQIDNQEISSETIRKPEVTKKPRTTKKPKSIVEQPVVEQPVVETQKPTPESTKKPKATKKPKPVVEQPTVETPQSKTEKTQQSNSESSKMAFPGSEFDFKHEFNNNDLFENFKIAVDNLENLSKDYNERINKLIQEISEEGPLQISEDLNLSIQTLDDLIKIFQIDKSKPKSFDKINSVKEDFKTKKEKIEYYKEHILDDIHFDIPDENFEFEDKIKSGSKQSIEKRKQEGKPVDIKELKEKNFSKKISPQIKIISKELSAKALENYYNIFVELGKQLKIDVSSFELPKLGITNEMEYGAYYQEGEMLVDELKNIIMLSQDLKDAFKILDDIELADKSFGKEFVDKVLGIIVHEMTHAIQINLKNINTENLVDLKEINFGDVIDLKEIEIPEIVDEKQIDFIANGVRASVARLESQLIAVENQMREHLGDEFINKIGFENVVSNDVWKETKEQLEQAKKWEKEAYTVQAVYTKNIKNTIKNQGNSLLNANNVIETESSKIRNKEIKSKKEAPQKRFDYYSELLNSQKNDIGYAIDDYEQGYGFATDLLKKELQWYIDKLKELEDFFKDDTDFSKKVDEIKVQFTKDYAEYLNILNIDIKDLEVKIPKSNQDIKSEPSKKSSTSKVKTKSTTPTKLVDDINPPVQPAISKPKNKKEELKAYLKSLNEETDNDLVSNVNNTVNDVFSFISEQVSNVVTSFTSSAEETQSLTEKGLNEYEKLFNELGKKLKIDTSSFSIPKIKVDEGDFPNYDAYFDQMKNTVYFSSENFSKLLKVLNNGVSESINNFGDKTVSESVSVLFHELTHAFQTALEKSSDAATINNGDVIDFNHIELPEIDSNATRKQIEIYAESSVAAVVAQLKAANPDKSIDEIINKYETLITNVRRKEVEAYTVERLLTKDIVESFKDRVDAVSSVSTELNNLSSEIPSNSSDTISLSDFINNIENQVNEANSQSDDIGNLFQGFSDGISGLFGQVTGVVGNVSTSIFDVFSFLSNQIKSIFDNLLGSAEKSIKEINDIQTISLQELIGLSEKIILPSISVKQPATKSFNEFKSFIENQNKDIPKQTNETNQLLLNVFDGFVGGISSLVDGIGSIYDGVNSSVNLFNNSIISVFDFFVNQIDSIVHSFSNIAIKSTEDINNIDIVLPRISTFNEPTTKSLSEFKDFIKNKNSDIPKQTNETNELMFGVFNGFIDGVSVLFDGIGSVYNGVNNAVNIFNSSIFNVFDFFTNQINNIFNSFTESLSKSTKDINNSLKEETFAILLPKVPATKSFDEFKKFIDNQNSDIPKQTNQTNQLIYNVFDGFTSSIGLLVDGIGGIYNGVNSAINLFNNSVINVFDFFTNQINNIVESFINSSIKSKTEIENIQNIALAQVAKPSETINIFQSFVNGLNNFVSDIHKFKNIVLASITNVFESLFNQFQEIFNIFNKSSIDFKEKINKFDESKKEFVAKDDNSKKLNSDINKKQKTQSDYEEEYKQYLESLELANKKRIEENSKVKEITGRIKDSLKTEDLLNALEEYKNIFNQVGKILNVDISNIELPVLEPKTYMEMGNAGGSFEEALNKITIDEDLFDILIKGVEKSFNECSDRTKPYIQHKLTSIIHELVHAIQSSFEKLPTFETKDVFSPKPLNIPEKELTQSQIERVETGSKASRDMFFPVHPEKWREKNPNDTNQDILDKHKFLIDEVYRREKEAYTAEIVLTEIIIESYKNRIENLSSLPDSLENINISQPQVSISSNSSEPKTKSFAELKEFIEQKNENSGIEKETNEFNEFVFGFFDNVVKGVSVAVDGIGSIYDGATNAFNLFDSSISNIFTFFTKQFNVIVDNFTNLSNQSVTNIENLQSVMLAQVSQPINTASDNFFSQIINTVSNIIEIISNTFKFLNIQFKNIFDSFKSSSVKTEKNIETLTNNIRPKRKKFDYNSVESISIDNKSSEKINKEEEYKKYLEELEEQEKRRIERINSIEGLVGEGIKSYSPEKLEKAISEYKNIFSTIGEFLNTDVSNLELPKLEVKNLGGANAAFDEALNKIIVQPDIFEILTDGIEESIESYGGRTEYITTKIASVFHELVHGIQSNLQKLPDVDNLENEYKPVELEIPHREYSDYEKEYIKKGAESSTNSYKRAIEYYKPEKLSNPKKFQVLIDEVKRRETEAYTAELVLSEKFIEIYKNRIKTINEVPNYLASIGEIEIKTENNIFGDIFDGITGFFGQIADTTGETISTITNNFVFLANQFRSIFQGFIGSANKFNKSTSKIKSFERYIRATNDKVLDQYKEVISQMGSIFGEDIANFEVPKIQRLGYDMPKEMKAAYEEVTNTIYVSQDVIDMLGNGIKNSADVLSGEVIEDCMSALVHELTHAFQANIEKLPTDPDSLAGKKKVKSKALKIPRKKIDKGTEQGIEQYAEASTQQYLNQLQKLMPGNSIAQIKNGYKVLLDEVKRREVEAYKAQVLLTGGIIDSFKNQVEAASDAPRYLASMGSIVSTESIDIDIEEDLFNDLTLTVNEIISSITNQISDTVNNLNNSSNQSIEALNNIVPFSVPSDIELPEIDLEILDFNEFFNDIYSHAISVSDSIDLPEFNLENVEEEINGIFNVIYDDIVTTIDNFEIPDFSSIELPEFEINLPNFGGFINDVSNQISSTINSIELPELNVPNFNNEESTVTPQVELPNVADSIESSNFEIPEFSMGLQELNIPDVELDNFDSVIESVSEQIESNINELETAEINIPEFNFPDFGGFINNAANQIESIVANVDYDSVGTGIGDVANNIASTTGDIFSSISTHTSNIVDGFNNSSTETLADINNIQIENIEPVLLPNNEINHFNDVVEEQAEQVSNDFGNNFLNTINGFYNQVESAVGSIELPEFQLPEISLPNFGESESQEIEFPDFGNAINNFYNQFQENVNNIQNQEIPPIPVPDSRQLFNFTRNAFKVLNGGIAGLIIGELTGVNDLGETAVTELLFYLAEQLTASFEDGAPSSGELASIVTNAFDSLGVDGSAIQESITAELDNLVEQFRIAYEADLSVGRNGNQASMPNNTQQNNNDRQTSSGNRGVDNFAKWIGSALRGQLGALNDVIEFAGMFDSLDDFINKIKMLGGNNGILSQVLSVDRQVTLQVDDIKERFFIFIDGIKQSRPALAPFIDMAMQGLEIFRDWQILEILSSSLFELAKSSIETAGRFQTLVGVTNFLAGSNKNATNTFTFLNSEIKRLSLDTESAIRGWNKLAATTRGTVLEGDVTKSIFTGVAQAGTAFGLTAEEMEGSITAMGQIAGKGVVSMEELRGQLAERIPGAFQIASRAMGMTEQELTGLISTGNLAATDFLPKFAKQLSIETAGSIESSTKTFAAASTRYKNSVTNFQVKFGESLLPAVAGYMDTLASVIDLVAKNAGFLGYILVGVVDTAFFGIIDKITIILKMGLSVPTIIAPILAGLLTLKNVFLTIFLPFISGVAKGMVGAFLFQKGIEAIMNVYDTFFGKLETQDINKNLSTRFKEAGKKTDELREKLAKLRGEIEKDINPGKKRNSSNLKETIQTNKKEEEKESILDILDGRKRAARQIAQIEAASKDVKENRNAKELKKSSESGEIKELSKDVKAIVSSSDLIISKSKEKSDAIGRLTIQAKDAEGKNLENIKKQIEVLQVETDIDLFKGKDGKNFGLQNIEDTSGNIESTIQELKKDLETTVQDEPRQILLNQIQTLEEYQKKLSEIIRMSGGSESITRFATEVSKIGRTFEEVSSTAEESLTKVKLSINKNLQTGLTTNINAENIAALEQARVEIFATQQKLKASQDVVDGLTGNLKGASGEIGEYFAQFKDFSLQKLQSELDKTDEQDVSRARTLEALIKLREAEGTTLELQSTLQEQLLQQERERMRVAQENLETELSNARANIDIIDANSQSASIKKQIFGGSSQADIGLIESDNQLKIAQEREKIRQQELEGIQKLNAQKLISAKDYDNKIGELNVQGAQNSLAILQAELQKEQAIRAKNVENIQRELEKEKISSEIKQTDIGFNIERKGFTNQQNQLKEEISTTKEDEKMKVLDVQKQLAERSGDVTKQEQANAVIYQQQLSSLTVKQGLQEKSLKITQEQQQLEMQRTEMQAQLALLEAESQVAQLQANKATAEEIDVANQTVAIRQKQVNFISEQEKNLNEVQKLERENLSVQNDAQKAEIERARILQLIEEQEKRINKELEVAKTKNELNSKAIERSTQLLTSQADLNRVLGESKQSELQHQIELSNRATDVYKTEELRKNLFAVQLSNLQQQNTAQLESLSLTHQQQQLQAQMSVLEAESTLRRLQLNKASAEDISLAQQQVDAANQQLSTLQQVQANEQLRTKAEQESAVTNLERQRQLELQDIAVQKINFELEKQKSIVDNQLNSLDLAAKAYERQGQILQAQQGLNDTNANLEKQRLDFQLELANVSGDFNKIEQAKTSIYLQQREEVLRQTEAQRQSVQLSLQQKEIEFKRQELQAQFALIEAQTNVERAKAQGVSGEQLAILQQAVGVQQANLDAIGQQRVANEQLKTLEEQKLATEQQTKLEQIDQQRQLQLIDVQVQSIARGYEKQKQALDLTVESLNLASQGLDRQSNLLNAESGLNQAIAAQSKQRLDYHLQLAEITENETNKEQIKQQIYQQQLQSLYQSQEIEKQSLAISQEKQQIDLESKKIQAEISMLEAQSNIEQAMAKGASESEVAALSRVLELRKQQQGAISAEGENLARIQELEKDKLATEQLTSQEQIFQSKHLEETRIKQDEINEAKRKQEELAKQHTDEINKQNDALDKQAKLYGVLVEESKSMRKVTYYGEKAGDKVESNYFATSGDYGASMETPESNAIVNKGTVYSGNDVQNKDVPVENNNIIKLLRDIAISTEKTFLATNNIADLMRGENLNQGIAPKLTEKPSNTATGIDPRDRLKNAQAAMDDYIAKFNSEAEAERLASGMSAEQATAGGYEQAAKARELAAKIKADLESGKLKTTGTQGFVPQQVLSPLQKLQNELNSAQKAVDSSKGKTPSTTNDILEQFKVMLETNLKGGTNVENLVIVSSDPTGDARQVLNDLKGQNC